jgi:hypothetical protein
MIAPPINRATHFSVVWAVVLAVITLVEWRSLDREPMSEQIFLPFIEREVKISISGVNTEEQPASISGDLPGTGSRENLQTHVQIGFNGPLFLVYFFGPIMIFHGIGLLFRSK